VKQVNQLTEAEARELLRQYQDWAFNLCVKFPVISSVELFEMANLEPLTVNQAKEMNDD
jgi:hypothetical protein